MKQFIRLELKKIRLRTYLSGALLANALIGLLWLAGTTAAQQTDYPITYEALFIAVGQTSRIVFMIFAAVLMVPMFIGEYKSKTITLMFSYPISRRKLFAAKLVIVLGMTFTLLVATNLFFDAVFYVVNEYFYFVNKPLSHEQMVQEVWLVLGQGLAVTFMTLIPLYLGMLRRSSVTLMISAVVMALIINATNDDLILSTVLTVNIFMALAGVACMWRLLYVVEYKDAV
ncbi:ABC transporter permease [Paenibacillus pinihumi]|uniref:ABC transporter permease n=1 Tax=Paenibacillus pinihumi TaxID=669462 RepID=UPI0003FDC2A0|nr:ABC transporter permease [Paenibacillus pinihumi]